MKFYDIQHILRTQYIYKYNITRIQDEIINHDSWYKNSMYYTCNEGIFLMNYLYEIRFKIQINQSLYSGFMTSSTTTTDIHDVTFYTINCIAVEILRFDRNNI